MIPVLIGDRVSLGWPLSGRAADDGRSSRPRFSPSRLPGRVERRIVALRFVRRWGLHRISYHLGLPRSTAGRVIARYRVPLLAHVDQAIGLRARKSVPVRYEMAAPGELVHVDIKKLGRIPNGGGWRKLGLAVGRRNNGRRGLGYAFMPHAVDDHSRLVYSEILDYERKETAAQFWTRARAFFTERGIAVTTVMTDNGFCYRSRLFAAALGDQVTHRRTRPYRPQTNGKVCEDLSWCCAGLDLTPAKV